MADTPVPANGGAGDSAKLMDMDDAAFAASLGIETGPKAPTAEAPRDTNGQFIAKDTVLDDTTLAADKSAETTEEKPADAETATDKPAETTEDKPADAPAEDKPAEAVKPPLTKFQMFDKEGELEVPTDVMLKYKVDGKYVENDLTKTVHLAQQAAFNARQVQDLTERNTAGAQQVNELLKTIQDYERNLSLMFSDENVYKRAVALHLSSNTPERRAEAAQEDANQVRQQWNQHQEQQAIAQFIAGTIEPALVELSKEYPSVEVEDLAGRLAIAMKGMEVNGRVPMNSWPKVAQFVNNDLAQWAEAVHGKRTAATQKASQSLEQERKATQAKQRQVAKALAPVSATASAPQKPAPITRASDVFNDPIFGGSQ